MNRLMTIAAVLAVSAAPGTPARRDTGQAPTCTMTVVSCNYAHLYSGKFAWQIKLRDADTQNEFNATVTVINGNAACMGSSATHDAKSGTNRGDIHGAGLIAVEFEPDSANNLTYRITAACPDPAYPGLRVGPAELGNSASHESYRMRATAIGQAVLKDSISYPAPETDPVNGVTGTVTVTWTLKR